MKYRSIWVEIKFREDHEAFNELKFLLGLIHEDIESRLITGRVKLGRIKYSYEMEVRKDDEKMDES